MSHWVDLILVILVALAAVRGFVRGFFREIFGLAGLILAVAAALFWYQGLASHMAEAYPLLPWQAQIIAFTLIAVAVGLLAALLTHIWVRIIRLTPFALIDRVAGGLFGGLKVVLVAVIILGILWSLGVPSIQSILAESHMTQQLLLLLPLFYRYGEEWWPEEWDRPAWIFPGPRVPADDRMNLTF